MLFLVRFDGVKDLFAADTLNYLDVEGLKGKEIMPEKTKNEDKAEKEFKAFKQLVDLWKSENPIKTTKLQVLLAVNGALLSVVQFNGGFVCRNLLIFYGSAILCFVWTLSIGRTALFQKVWHIKIETLSSRYPNDPRFQVLKTDEEVVIAPRWLRIIGGVSSKYYLLAAPVVFGLFWVWAILYVKYLSV